MLKILKRIFLIIILSIVLIFSTYFIARSIIKENIKNNMLSYVTETYGNNYTLIDSYIMGYSLFGGRLSDCLVIRYNGIKFSVYSNDGKGKEISKDTYHFNLSENKFNKYLHQIIPDSENLTIMLWLNEGFNVEKELSIEELQVFHKEIDIEYSKPDFDIDKLYDVYFVIKENTQNTKLVFKEISENKIKFATFYPDEAIISKDEFINKFNTD